ncbi:hypothetical protein DRO29_04730 [Candidatus Bathyarchaeota archaeon]|nr:MAG: hypothetical protein DRO29_04730 [Candidatus Bathyarchaeota archaeon]HDJ04837.1 hypothetical protein [Candidatus Bathyarchaeota archaeon]
MVKFRLNIFFVMAILCILVLIGYLWLVLLPIFEGSLEYAQIRRIVTFSTALLLLSAVLLTMSMLKRE